VDLLNDFGATALCIGAGIQAVTAANGVLWDPDAKRHAFSTGWWKDADMWGWAAVFLGAFGVAVAAWAS